MNDRLSSVTPRSFFICGTRFLGFDSTKINSDAGGHAAQARWSSQGRPADGLIDVFGWRIVNPSKADQAIIHPTLFGE